MDYFEVVLIVHVSGHHELIELVLLHLNQKQTERKLLIHQTELTLVLVYRQLFFIAFTCAAEPTRETEIPTLIAGRIPPLKISADKKI